MRCGRGTVLIFVLGGLACARARPSEPRPAPRHGESGYRALAEAEVVEDAAEPGGETITAIHPLAGNRAPSYPDGALRAGCGDGLVPVRVHIGIDGRVSEIRPIPGRGVASDACHREFEAEVRRVVGTWEFLPAYRVRRRAAEAPGAEPTVEREPLGLDLDYEFSFTVVEGMGTVRSR
jgi:outer membrane biosynthesis protein TonB